MAWRYRHTSWGLQVHTLMGRQGGIQKRSLDIILTQVQATGGSKCKDGSDGRGMRNRRVGQLVVPPKLLAVTADDKPGFVAKHVARTIAFYLEYPLGWDSFGTTGDSAGHDKTPNLVLLERCDLFLNGKQPFESVWRGDGFIVGGRSATRSGVVAARTHALLEDGRTLTTLIGTYTPLDASHAWLRGGRPRGREIGARVVAVVSGCEGVTEGIT